MSHLQPNGYPGPPFHTQVLVQPYRCSTAHVVVAWVVAVLTSLYMLPWAIAATRNRRNVGTVALVDALLGWTVVGWVVALVMACGGDQPVVVVQNTYPQPPYPSAPGWQPPQQWVQSPPQPQPWSQTPPPPAPPALPPAPARPPYQAPSPYAARPAPTTEPTVVDPTGSEPTRPLPRSPWEPDDRR